MRKIRIAIADDHEMVRQSLKNLLSQSFDVVFDVADGIELLRKLEHFQVDVVLLDLEMPHMDGYEALCLMRKSYPDVKSLMLSHYHHTDFIVKAIQLNAKGFLTKNASYDQLKKAIYCVSEKGYYFDDALKYITPLKEKNSFSFTNKEIAIIRMACSGKTNKEIATMLNISVKTVENHRSSIFNKAQIKNIAQLVLMAIQEGIIAV